MRVAVLCIGNELLMDEGAGPACGRYLASRWELPSCVEVIDCAAMGLAILPELRSHDHVLVLDVVDVPGARPGALFSFAPEDVATSAQMASLHEMRFGDVMQAARLVGVSCEGHCLGVQAENISPAEFIRALTPRVGAAVPLLAATAARWLRDELGLDVRDRVAGEDPRRAGQGPRPQGARDFSGAYEGASASLGPRAATPEEERAGGVTDELGVTWPLVHGLPDASVMAGYLAAGLAAVGARVGEVEAPEGEPARVPFDLPEQVDDAARDALIARFGLVRAPAGGGAPQLSAIVTPEIRDYDCDALIGACQDLLGRLGR